MRGRRQDSDHGPMRRQGARGYVLAEALVSAAIASLAGLLSVTLLVWASQAVDRTQSAIGAMKVLSRLYETSRLATPDALGRPSSGVIGRYAWIRSPSRSLSDDMEYAPVPVRFDVSWLSGGKVQRRELRALVRPITPEAAP
jgi:type II secretory pathway pseudopilin PulG